MWNAPLGGQVPCYSSLRSYLVPPAVPLTSQTPASIPITSAGNRTTLSSKRSSLSSKPAKPTSAIVNVVYAVAYPVQDAQGLSTGAKAGIGAGAGVAGIAIVALSILLFRMTRKHKKDKAKLAAIQARGPDSTRQSQSVISSTPAISPYAYSTRTELQTDGPNHQVQTPGSFGNNGYFIPHHMQRGPPTQGYNGQQPPQMQHLSSQGYYGQQPAQYMQQPQGQPPAHYPSPPSSTVSPPPGSEGHSYQTGYISPELMTQHPPSTASPPPGSEGQGYQTSYTAPGSGIQRKPVSTASPLPVEGYNLQGEPGAPVQEMEHSQRQELHGQSRPGEMGT